MAPAIVVPLDGSYFSEAILTHVAKLAHGRPLRVVLLRVAPLPRDHISDEGHISTTAEKQRTEIEEDYLRYLRERELQIADPQVQTECQVRFGDAVEEILACVRQTNAVMVAMTTHGRTGLGRLLFGSVAAAVLRRSTVPVALYRPPGL